MAKELPDDLWRVTSAVSGFIGYAESAAFCGDKPPENWKAWRDGLIAHADAVREEINRLHKKD